MFVVFFASLLAVGFAEPPIWYTGGQCGVSLYEDAGSMDLPPGKIVGGQVARPYEFPWQVSIRHKSSDGHYCGGSIINEQWVVSSASCMGGETPATVSVVVGEHEMGEISIVRQVHEVNSIFVHEDYRFRTHENDISVIKTSLGIVFSVQIQPICAPDPAVTYHYSLSQVSGWGTVDSGPGGETPLTLRYVTLNVTTQEFCQDAYNRDTIYNDMICASDNVGGIERDACEGDTGGPLSVKGSGAIFTLIGVVSWGNGCASGYPGVYSRVAYHAEWITDTITIN
jgi:secreted trypsin-like serine protease